MDAEGRLARARAVRAGGDVDLASTEQERLRSNSDSSDDGSVHFRSILSSSDYDAITEGLQGDGVALESVSEPALPASKLRIASEDHEVYFDPSGKSAFLILRETTEEERQDLLSQEISYGNHGADATVVRNLVRAGVDLSKLDFGDNGILRFGEPPMSSDDGKIVVHSWLPNHIKEYLQAQQKLQERISTNRKVGFALTILAAIGVGVAAYITGGLALPLLFAASPTAGSVLAELGMRFRRQTMQMPQAVTYSNYS